MAEIRAFPAIRDKWTRANPGSTEAEIKALKKTVNGNESSFHIPPRIYQPVNPYQLIQRLNRIIKLQKQANSLLTQEIKELKSL